MKKILSTIMACVVILGFGVITATAQTWTWDPPAHPLTVAPVVELVGTLTELAVDPVTDQPYGISGVDAVMFSLGDPVTEDLMALPGTDTAAKDLTVGFERKTYVVTNDLVRAVNGWNPTTYENLVAQPLVPPYGDGLEGTFEHIASGKNGKLFVLYQDSDGDQFILVGNPPATAVTATVRITPKTLNLKSKGNWVTCKIGLQEDYSNHDLDLDQICITAINGAVLEVPVCRAPGSPTEFGEKLMVKFSRSELITAISAALSGAKGKSSVELTVSGVGEKIIDPDTTPPTVESFQFSAVDEISVLGPKK